MSNFRNRLRKLGFISIEVVLIGSVVLAGGLIGVDKLMRNGSGASNHQQGVFNSLFIQPQLLVGLVVLVRLQDFTKTSLPQSHLHKYTILFCIL